jgi:DNA-binding transcriptional regulator YhcF (GntR family)
MRKTNRIVFPFLISFGVLVIGCGGADARMPSAAPHAEAVSAPAQPGAPPAPPPPAPAPAAPHDMAGAAAPHVPGVPAKTGQSASTTPSGNKAKDGAPDLAQSIIYTGAVTMRAKRDDYAKTIDKVIDVAESLGGAINSRRDDGVEIKIPSQSFRRAMSELENVGEVESRSVTAQDVSEEMHDLDVRLLNLKATRKRLEEFLNKANTIEATLQVERELERVAVEIDRIEGRLAFLRAHASFSTISIAFHEKPKEVAPVVATPPPPPPTPPAKIVNIPASWIDKVGIDPLMLVR